MRALGVTLCLVAVPCGCGSGGDSSNADASLDAHADPDASPAPSPVCNDPVAPADVSHPTTVVTTCTEAALRAAVATGGVIVFECGAAPTTITITAPIDITQDTTIDGRGTVTLDGGNTTRILHLASTSNVATPTLTVQHLAFTRGRTTDVPNTTSTRAGGAAVFQDGGSLTVIDCTFTENHCADSGRGVSGGAISGQGIGTLVIEDSVFDLDSGSNGGAVGTQDEQVTIVNSTFTSNYAIGNSGNGGNGGALDFDGADVPLTLCGDSFRGNHAYMAGGAVFRVAYHDEPTTIDRSTFDHNSVDPNSGLAGGLYLENTTIEMTGTTVSNNQAWDGGGIWIGNAAIAHLTNVTIADNQAYSAMGGGVWFALHVAGTFTNVTVAGNSGNGALFGDDSGVSLANTIVTAGISFEPCTVLAADGGHDLDYPPGQGDCTLGVTVMDPQLGALADHGGPTQTMMPAAGSPAIGAGASCPPTDQRGMPRAAACTLGAVEAP